MVTETKDIGLSAAEHLRSAKRIVVKIGSALLVDDETGRLRAEWLNALTDDVAALIDHGAEVVLVSSGAIAVGRNHLGLARGKLRLEEKQASAATGQIILAHAYQEALARHKITVSQILLTLGDTEERRRHLNARNTLTTLLKLGAVPVINENDTVATSEIRFGDNDRLAARVGAMIDADLLVLLSDIDGLYTADPKRDPSARFLPVIKEITPEIDSMAGEALPGYSSGGMITKIAAAKIAVGAGCNMIIANGHQLNPLSNVMEGKRASVFEASIEPKTARKRYIAGSLQPLGTVIVDNGALKALQSGKSLLPAGVTAIEGKFQRGDAVVIKSLDGREIARGLAAYSNGDAHKIIGLKSSEIEQRLGYLGREELIHRDDLVLI
ncbi:glutamate 5-kinase [Kiloniella laminariae]|uniref:Glutamate 5-kinase n=1 Tax=Kiloniella laminariae TaxID=454162 RepID=A0ABT4LPS6_9PROT|nr:glutamate 5-kinase [Kiloniella laminariae]MCZ4282316.1 glutamate 5-kinase [Kiloniella laminariae]